MFFTSLLALRFEHVIKAENMQMKFDKIDIQLLGANEHGYFYSGQAASGHVIADLSAPISIESIVVVLKGAE